MRISKLIPALLAIVIIFGSCQSGPQSNESQSAKYVFYFIGDGVSLPQLSLTEAYLAQKSGQKGMKQLNQSQLEAHGWFYTYADNRFITGSAAAGTALSTGHKTSINTIAKSADRTQNYKSIAYKAKEAGMKVGIISTVSINHATPAAFYANANERNSYYEIADQMFASGFDLFAGGGIKDSKGEQEDLPDLYEKKTKLKILQNNAAFLNAEPGSLPLYFSHERLQSGAAMPFAIDMNEFDVTLQEVTRKSIELLNNPEGFFMMIEGGKIDWACHANDAAATISGMVDFDNAVGQALHFAEKHPDETLIVVLGDHETGGLTLGNDDMHYETNFTILQHQKISHEALEREIEQLIQQDGTLEEAMQFIDENLGLGSQIELTKAERQRLKESWKASTGYSGQNVELLYSSVHEFLYEAIKIQNRKAGVGWTSTSHTGLPVVVHAHGVGATHFDGILDNTDIPKLIEKIIK